MKTSTPPTAPHIGRKIERVRRLRGMSQTELGDLLGVSKQAVSKMEHTKKINDERLEQISDALGVTEEGLKKLTGKTVLSCTGSFDENSNATATTIDTASNHENLNHFSMERTIKLFEELIKIEREEFARLGLKNKARQAI